MKRKLIFAIIFLWALIASTAVSYAQYGKGVGATKARISRTKNLADRPSFAKPGFRFTIDIDNGLAFPNHEYQPDLGDNPHKPFYELTGTVGCGYQLNPFFYLGIVGGSGFATVETSQAIYIDNWTYEIYLRQEESYEIPRGAGYEGIFYADTNSTDGFSPTRIHSCG